MSFQNISDKLNKNLLDLDIYTSKAISLEAQKDKEIVNLSFGEPEFGPPDFFKKDFLEHELSVASFLDSVKRYENPRGSLELRKSICLWYKRRYGLEIDPETEIMITHGGVEAITLAILCTTEIGDTITVTNPSYMLYKRTITALGRESSTVNRFQGDHEYEDIFFDKDTGFKLNKSKAIIINSPENPSGYVVDKQEWELIGDYSNRKGFWVIHDEVYDTMAFKRQHIPCRMIPSLSEQSILINSFSKKFGMPGLRIGWMIAHKKLIDLAAKTHDYLYLGVNILNEKIGMRLIADLRSDAWLSEISNKLESRADKAIARLNSDTGFTWARKPFGAMFLFPNVRKLYDQISHSYKLKNRPIGDVVAEYLLKERKVAVVPGSVYGTEGNEHVRLVLCTNESEFDIAIERLSSIKCSV